MAIITKLEKEAFRNELAKRQQVIKEKKIPVVVIFDGYGAAGKGCMLGNIIKYMDPRFFKVYNMDVKYDEEYRYPFLHRYFTKIPLKGQFSFFNGSYMDEAVTEYIEGKSSFIEYMNRLESIVDFERQLIDNGYVVVKFFFETDKKTQKKRMKTLLSDKDTKFRVSDKDIEQNKLFDGYRAMYEDYMDETYNPLLPWHIVNFEDKNAAEYFIAKTIIREIDRAVEKPYVAEISEDDRWEIASPGRLADFSMEGCVISEDEYAKRLKKLQKELHRLHNKLYRYKIPVVIAYEGWDAAGKGGNIKRIAGALDPRGYEVFPIAGPTPDEKGRHYLWRFYNRLPKTGHIAVFDRTWYGRVMVERLEGFCSENDWKRAYNEINEFERDLTDYGAIVIKFWVQIDKDTQLERFTLRQNTPEKQWKITDEDWRNREKWDLYEEAVDEMIAKTSTVFAPWHILPSNDKRFARIRALEIIIDEIKKCMPK